MQCALLVWPSHFLLFFLLHFGTFWCIYCLHFFNFKLFRSFKLRPTLNPFIDVCHCHICVLELWWCRFVLAWLTIFSTNGWILFSSIIDVHWHNILPFNWMCSFNVWKCYILSQENNKYFFFIMMKKKDENHTYLMWSLFCSRDPVNVKYIQSVLLWTWN